MTRGRDSSCEAAWEVLARGSGRVVLVFLLGEGRDLFGRLRLAKSSGLLRQGGYAVPAVNGVQLSIEQVGETLLVSGRAASGAAGSKNLDTTAAALKSGFRRTIGHVGTFRRRFTPRRF